MNKKPIITHDAVRPAPAELLALAGRILTAAVALLLMSGTFGGRAWAITGGEVDQNNAYPKVGAVVLVPPTAWTPGPMALGSGTLIHPRVLLSAGHVTRILELFPGTIPLTYVSFDPYSVESGQLARGYAGKFLGIRSLENILMNRNGYV